jgi:integrase
MRLEPGEEERRLASAGPHLQRLIIAALETCCRQGELLSLQWRDVSLGRREIVLRATDRVIPVSDRLKAVLDEAPKAAAPAGMGGSCKNVASEGQTAHRPPCNEAPPSDDESLIHQGKEWRARLAFAALRESGGGPHAATSRLMA